MAKQKTATVTIPVRVIPFSTSVTSCFGWMFWLEVILAEHWRFVAVILIRMLIVF